MTTRSIILSPHEVRAALADALGLVVRPVSLRHVHDIEEDGTSMRECKGGIWREATCPLGVPGDRLRCREGWHTDQRDLERAKAMHEDVMSSSPIFYQADPANRNAGCIWRSPATMPAWASRITLEVVGVRCVRVDRLYESEAERTGIGPELVPPDGGGSPHKEGLRTFWESKYGRRYPWESSWAWAVAVRRVEG